MSTARYALAAAVLACAASCAPARAASPAVRLSRHAIPESARWKTYDQAPAQATVRPVRVLDVTGGVENPDGLVDASGPTTLNTGASLILDYGKDVGGYPEFDVAAGTGVLNTSYSETKVNLGQDGATSTTLFQNGNGARTDTLTIVGAGPVTATLISGAQRYEKVTATGTITLRGADIRFTPPRDTPDRIAGHFLSSDDLLNRIWWAGAYTLDLNELAPGTATSEGASQQHLLLDGAKRDRAVWSGDQVIANLTAYAMSDPAYARDSLGLLLSHPASGADNLSPALGDAAQPGPFPGVCSPSPGAGNFCLTWSANYALVLVPAVLNYYEHTGDLAFVRAHWPAIERLMRWAGSKVDANGLFAVSGSEGTDWNLENPQGETTYNNALYVDALTAASKLASALGEPADAFAKAAGTVKAAVNRVLWNAKTGVYDSSDTVRGPIVQDANVTAILSGVASPARALAITRVLRKTLATPYGPVVATADAPGYIRDISPYMGSFHVLADYAAGNGRAALALMRREWGYMVDHDPGGVVWERIQPNGVPAPTSGALAIADSMAHAWSTGPTAAMSTYILGVAPAAPGFATWTVAPQPGDLRYAQGVVPTPKGPISVRWRRAHRFFELTVSAPAGTTGRVGVGRGTVARDGRVLRHARATVTQRAGTHTYAWKVR